MPEQMKPEDAPCPRQDEHTPAPAGYVAWHEWAERMDATHRQRRCPGCGLYAVWEPKDGATPPIDHAQVGTSCRAVRLHI